MLLRTFGAFFLLCFCAGAYSEEADYGRPATAEIQLTHGTFDLRLYPTSGGDPRALVVFGSGDGGWSDWEHTVCAWLQEANVAAAGFDFGKYAATDYDQPVLAKDMAAAAAFAAKRLGAKEVPVLYAGWSIGAVQAVAAAAGTNRPASLSGLLLLSLDSRGRYGIRAPDMVGITPTGPGTFDLLEFNQAVSGLRVVQYHGTADFMAKTTWIRLLKSPHQLYLLQGMNHGFDGPVDEFRPVFLQGVAWALGDESAAAAPENDTGSLPVEMMVYSLLLFLLLAVLVSDRTALVLLPVSVSLCGVAGILETVFPGAPSFIAEMEAWVPLEVSQHGRFLLFLSGAVLLVLARGLHRRKRVAWHMAVLSLAVSAVLNFTQTFNWNRSAVAAVLLVALLRHRKLFTARSDAASFRVGAAVAFSAMLLLAAYGTVSLHVFGARGLFGNPLSWAESLQGTVLTALQVKTELDELAGREAAHLLHTIRLQGLGVGLLALVMVLRPVIPRRHAAHSGEDTEKVKRLIEMYAGDSMAVFALLADKRYYFQEGTEGVVAYALWRDIAVVLSDPICPPECREKLVTGFIRFCRGCDWKPVFYCLRHVHRDIYEEAGFQLLRIAEEAQIELNGFSLAGKRFQNLRTARNKAVKNGLQFGWYGAGRTEPSLEKQFEELSKEWLGKKRGGELGFDLSSFSLESLRETGAAWVKTADGLLLAFATWHAYDHGRGRCLDLMRSRPEPKDVMDFLILESMEAFKAQGVKEVSFGSAPLANLAHPDEHSRHDRAIRFVFEKFDRFYGYKRLFFFKQKYHPCWTARYLAYPRGTPLGLVGLAVAGVHLTHGFRSLFRS